MLKISEGTRENQSLTLKLEGSVVGPWVEELRQIGDLLLADGTKLALDLQEVSYADESGLALLASFKRRGARLLNTAPFVKEQLKAVGYP
ncbi:MAG: hypothetical protein U1F83_07955 [Verrucomicrobiota bacterium]